MRIEMLTSDKTNIVVGVSEIHNTNKLGQNELLELAKSLTRPGFTIQLMNGHLIVDDTHLLSAAQNALNAQEGGYMQARSLDVEIIVYASTQRQIGRALEDLGVFDGIKNVAVVVIGKENETVKESLHELAKRIGKESKTPFKAVRKRFEKIREHYQIDMKEVRTFTDSDDVAELQKALAKCVVSRVSLVGIDS